jgi:hypothetical protein
MNVQHIAHPFNARRLLLSDCLPGELGLAALPHVAAQDTEIAVADDPGGLILETPGLRIAALARKPCGT